MGQKNIFLANQRDGFRHFWNWFGKRKCPGALQPLKQTFAPKMSLARKYRIVLTSRPWVSEDEKVDKQIEVIDGSWNAWDIFRGLDPRLSHVRKWCLR